MKHLKYAIVTLSVATLTVMSFPSTVLGQSVGDRVRVTTDDDKFIGTD